MFAALIPVKPPALAKSRLSGLPGQARRELVAAMALDTVAACLEAGLVDRVLMVTDDAGFAAQAREVGAETIPDGTTAGLNPTLRVAAAEIGRRWPDLAPVALLGDLPALRAAELDAALGSITPGDPAYVADAEGSGTTAYTASAWRFEPRFGSGSAAAHAERSEPIAGDLPGLRHDVDDLEDLRLVWDLGVGPRTQRRAAPLLGYGPPGARQVR